MAKAIKVVESYSMDYSFRVQYAESVSGAFFSRMQYRDPRYGYKWGKWKSARAFWAGSECDPAKVRLPY